MKDDTHAGTTDEIRKAAEAYRKADLSIAGYVTVNAFLAGADYMTQKHAAQKPATHYHCVAKNAFLKVEIERDAALARIEKLRAALERECMCKRIHQSIEQCAGCVALAEDDAAQTKESK